MAVFDRATLKQLWKASAVGLNLVISTVIGGLMGYGLDYLMERWFGIKTAPWLLFIFAIFGIIAGFRDLISLARHPNDESNKKNP
ncbi:MAG: AtpZ/AtpI family protein [Nitrospirota bacterium]